MANVRIAFAAVLLAVPGWSASASCAPWSATCAAALRRRLSLAPALLAWAPRAGPVGIGEVRALVRWAAWHFNRVTRTVLLLGPFAFKFPRVDHGWPMFLRGLLCNTQEAQFSRCALPELCPVVWQIRGGFLVVMRRARPLTDAEWAAVPDDYAERPDYVIPVEMKRDSFGILDGRLVALDYGS